MVTRKEYMTQMERLRNERSEEICKKFRTLKEENAGFKAGDVYQALAAAGKALSLAEIAKAAKITAEDAILGIGWLLKEGKIKNEDNKLVLA